MKLMIAIVSSLSLILLLETVKAEHVSVQRDLAAVPFAYPSSRATEDEPLKITARSSFRIRSFREATSTASPAKDDNEIDDSPVPMKVWLPGGLDFSCKGRAPGYYSDPSPLSKCQVYHMCMSDGRKYSLLCGIGTVFNQITFVCDHWYNYRCSDAESDYKRNDQSWDQFLSPVRATQEEYDYEDNLQTTLPPSVV